MSRHLGARLLRPLGLALAVMWAGCDRGDQDQPTPQVGAACAECATAVSDERFTAQYRLADGTMKTFDDPGCLFRAMRNENGAPSVVRFRAFGGERWLTGEQTWFARTPATTSPHGYGWAAFPSFGEAQEAVSIAGSGEILTYEQAVQRIGAP